ncbi:Anaerobic ribonucleoside-triphosphate reductase [Escherichia coli]|uniref:Anaerobic ribonucleoside-triphosphate reductase n=1 Tax=Escherichia coli TaxID=562 RepID=A0A485JLA9_ECOLX|nr:Anaerobic ribonucleoside-triphosphate reductase [Escherichia coli]
MTPHVMKRDGCKVPFKSERIKEAILRAAKAAEVDDADYCATVAAVVSEQMQGRNQVDINEIQTAVENQLMSGPYKQLARAYIEYRHDRDIEREKRGPPEPGDPWSGRADQLLVTQRKRQQRQQGDSNPARSAGRDRG